MIMGKQTTQPVISGPVLVTGHTGFKGAWFVSLLNTFSIEIAGYSLEPTPNSLYSKLNHSEKFRQLFADVRDQSKLSKFIHQTKPEIIFHFAAQSLVIDSYADPVNTFSTNVMGTANLLEAAFKCDSVRVIIIVTTDKVYQNDNLGRRFTERDPLMGKDPYSASKVGTEQVVSAWQNISSSFGGPKVVAVRAGNVIGGGDVSANRLLPDIVKAFLDKKTLEIRNPNSSRPWQHVLDPLAGYLLTANYALAGGALPSFNFSGDEKSLYVNEVVEIACNAWGPDANDYVRFGSSENLNIEAENLDLDSTQAREILHWESNWTQQEAVKSTLDWWKNTKLEGRSPHEICQIEIEKLIANFRKKTCA